MRCYPGRSNVVGELDYGHASLVGVGHGAAYVRLAIEKTVRSYEASDIAHHDEEHHRPGRLPTDGYFLTVVRR